MGNTKWYVQHFRRVTITKFNMQYGSQSKWRPEPRSARLLRLSAIPTTSNNKNLNQKNPVPTITQPVVNITLTDNVPRFPLPPPPPSTRPAHPPPSHINAVRSRMKAERGKSCSQADLSKQKWNDPVSCSQHSRFGTCPFEGRGSGGGGEIPVLAVKVCRIDLYYT